MEEDPELQMEGEKTTGTPAPYGRACTNCARAKCSCIYRPGGDNRTCDRCHRLKKQCMPSVSVRKRNGRRLLGSRTAQLEEKLEDLVTLLKNQQAPGQGLQTPVQTASGAGVAPAAATNPAASGSSGSFGVSTPSTSTHSPYDQPEEAVGGRPTVDRRPTPGDMPDSGPSNIPRLFPGTLHLAAGEVRLSGKASWPPPEDPPSLLSCAGEPTGLQAEESLQLFRRHMLNYLPFVFIPEHMSAKDLRGKYPFLWFNIMTVTSRSVAQQITMSESIKRFIGQKMAVEHDKNMDLLLGIICVLGWTHFHRKDKPFLSILCSLALALVYDLELNKVPAESSMLVCFKSWDPGYWRNTGRGKERTMQERRSVLTVFFLTCQVAYSMKRIDGLAWTSHMEECLEALAKAPECQGDKQLVAQVRIQLVVDQVHRVPAQVTPPASYASTLHAQVDNVRKQLSPRLQQNDAITGQLVYADLVIQDFVLQRTPVSQHVPDYQRHELLAKHLQTIKQFYDGFFAIDSEKWFGMTFAYWCYMAQGLVSLFRLTTMSNDPSWDRHTVLRDVDLFSICERVAEGFDNEAAKRRLTAGVRAEEDIIVRSAKILRLMKDGWLAELQAINNQHGGQGQGQPSGAVPGRIGSDGGPAQMPMPGGANVMNSVQGGEFFTNFDGGGFPMTMPMMMMNDAAWLSDLFNVSGWD